jgi:ribose transport system substrate-binding protein
MNKKEKNSFVLEMLTKQVDSNLIDRRAFIKGAVALGLTASSAMLLYQAYDHRANGTATVYAQDGELIRRLPELSTLPLDMSTTGIQTEGKSVYHPAIFLAHPYVEHSNRVFAKECKDLGMEYQVADAAFDPAKESELMDLAVSRNFDLIIAFPIDPAASSVGIRRARENGQLVVNWSTESLAFPTLAVSRDHYNHGLLNAKWMAERLPTGAKVVGGVGELLTTAGNNRWRGFLDGSAEYGLDLLSFEEGTAWTQEGGYQVGQALFARFPEIDGMYGGDDQGALGFAKAAVDAGRREEMVITGNDGLREGQDAVFDGRLDGTVVMRRGHGPEALFLMYQAAALMRGGVHGDAFYLSHIPDEIFVDQTTIGDQWLSPV